MSKNFYDRIAKKFGGYGYGTAPKKYKCISTYPDGHNDPENIFKSKLLELSSRQKVALDIGCADGKFTLQIAQYFKEIYGIDTSKVNLDIAKSVNKNKQIENVQYFLQNAGNTSFKGSTFDLAYNRRGPSFYKEYCRILKPKGHYLEIGIGEKDTIELKKIFGRGQNYGNWNTSRLEKDINELKDLAFSIVFAKDYHYFEYYPSFEAIDIFLQGVPIFEDFDSEKDRPLLQKYVKKYSKDKGIEVSRHRIVMVAQKI